MENLNKENFWNPMMEKYPNAVKLFCDWIDKWKLENQWHLLSITKRDGALIETTYIRFYDLPIAVQFGILHQWIEELYEADRVDGWAVRVFCEYSTSSLAAGMEDMLDHIEKDGITNL